MMERGNQSQLTEFILLGFSITPQTSIVLFVVFLIIYLVTVAANSLIITVTQADARLHSPMYFFLCNLSFLDLCFLTTNVPTCLKGFLYARNTISFSGCMAQLLIGISLGSSQGILLAVMACDRYVAICDPLNYHRLMSRMICIRLAIATWASGVLLSTGQMHFVVTLPFCGHNRVDHVVCEVAAVLRLACADIRLFEFIVFVVCVVYFVSPLSLIIFTYVRIISTIMRIPTAAGRQKAFSTCGSHLVVVTLFYSTTLIMYLRPRSAISTDKDKVTSLFYGLATPALNPLIYTLRNKDVKAAVHKILTKDMSLHRSIT